MSLFITLLTVFMVMVSLLLALITLMQRPKQEGLGAAFGGGMMNDTFGAQTTDVLQKGTIWLTIAFFGTAILLTVLNTRHFENERNVGNILEGVQQPEPIPSFPIPDAVPSTGSRETAPKSETQKSDSDSAPKTESKNETSKSSSAKSAPSSKTDAGNNKAAESKSEKSEAPTKADTPKPSAKEKDKQ